MFNYIYNLIFRNYIKQEILIKNFILARYTHKKYINFRNKVIIIQRWIKKYCLNLENIFLTIQRKQIKNKTKLILNTK